MVGSTYLGDQRYLREECMEADRGKPSSIEHDATDVRTLREWIMKTGHPVIQVTLGTLATKSLSAAMFR